MPDEWEQLEQVEGLEQPWDQLESVDTIQVAAPPEIPENGVKSESVFSHLKNVSAGEAIGAVAENVLTAATAIPAAVVGGLGELTASANTEQWPVEKGTPEYEQIDRMNYEDGRPTFQGGGYKPGETIAAAYDDMVYQPRTEVGQKVQEFIGDKFEQVDQMVADFAYGAGDPEKHAPGAAAAYTALQFAPLYFIPAIFGRGFMGKGKGKGKAPSSQSLKQQANELYTRADSSGAAVTAESYSGIVNAIEQRLAREGFDLSLHPDTAAALTNLKGKAGNNQTLMGVEINRKVINSARGAMKPDDARMASIMMDTYDDWYRSLSRNDMMLGSPEAAALYQEARGLWHRKMKSDEIEWAIERAAIRADANYSGAAFETALRQEFAAILKNKKRRRMFNENELGVIRAVTAGTLPQNFLRLLGKVAPRGVVSGAPGAALMTIEPTLGAATWLVGEGAKRAATGMTSRLAEKAGETVRQAP